MTLAPHEQATAQQTPRQVVDALFAAMQRGDRDEIVALLSESVEWWVAGPPEIPYAGTFRGHDEVAQFFATFNGSIDYESWDAHEFIAEGNTVVVVGEERWRSEALMFVGADLRQAPVAYFAANEGDRAAAWLAR